MRRSAAPSRLGLGALFTLLSLALSVTGRADDADALLGRWLAAQTNVMTWSADFTQTRHLKALTQPLTSTGHVWFAAPDRFRWELGQPPRSVALRAGDELLVLAPKLKRAERYPLAEAARGPMKDALALLDTGFPRDAADFRRRFDLLALTEEGTNLAFRLQPKSASARKLLPEITVVVAADRFALTATELRFADGSRLRNDFTNEVKNAEIEAERFASPVDATWKMAEPLKAR